MPSELDVQLEVERLSVRDFAKCIQDQEAALRESYDHQPTPPTSNESRESRVTADSKGGHKKKHKYGHWLQYLLAKELKSTF